MALIGAYILAGELASHADHAAAFAAYERISRPYIEANQAIAPGGAAVVIPETAEALHLRNQAIQAAAAGGPDKLLGAKSRPMINSFRLPKYAAA
jgi:2-polyprenyl-6-methoxyphenol hydroxylase-like FAD-dependent oxidoreductase